MFEIWALFSLCLWNLSFLYFRSLKSNKLLISFGWSKLERFYVPMCFSIWSMERKDQGAILLDFLLLEFHLLIPNWWPHETQATTNLTTSTFVYEEAYLAWHIFTQEFAIRKSHWYARFQIWSFLCSHDQAQGFL